MIALKPTMNTFEILELVGKPVRSVALAKWRRSKASLRFAKWLIAANV
jgi:hypothetical protein